MRINFEKMTAFSNRINNIRATLTAAESSVEHVRQILIEKEMFEDTSVCLQKITQEIDSQITILQNYALAVEKIKELFIAAEQRIETAVEDGEYVKRDFVPLLPLKNNTSFSWRII